PFDLADLVGDLRRFADLGLDQDVRSDHAGPPRALISVWSGRLSQTANPQVVSLKFRASEPVRERLRCRSPRTAPAPCSTRRGPRGTASARIGPLPSFGTRD